MDQRQRIYLLGWTFIQEDGDLKCVHPIHWPLWVAHLKIT